MYVPRSAYNDVNSPKIGFPYLFKWYQSQKNHCIVLHYIQTHLLKRGKLCQIHCQPHFSRQEIYEAAKLTKAEVTILHPKAKVFFLLLKGIVGHQSFYFSSQQF